MLERASARETAARVALGALARSFLAELGIRLVSHTLSIGPVRVPEDAPLPHPDDVDALDADPLRCFDPATSAADGRRGGRRPARTATRSAASSRCSPTGFRPGWARTCTGTAGSTRSSPRALMSIQAIKGVEVGDGFLTTTRRGSQAHDELVADDGGIARLQRRAGGTEGGMSTGTVLRVRAGMKPIATVPHALRTVDVATGEAAPAHHQRSDVCAVPGRGRRRRGDGRAGARGRRAGEVRRRLASPRPAATSTATCDASRRTCADDARQRRRRAAELARSTRSSS